MSGQIRTREFSIEDYDAAVELWKEVESVEIAEGDSREEMADFWWRAGWEELDGAIAMGRDL